MRKRNNGEGTIRQRPDGRWEARIHETLRDGTRARKSLFGKTHDEVRRKLREASTRVENELPAIDAATRLSIWIAEWEATILRASNRKATTKELYRNLARKHLAPEPFGALALRAVTPRAIDSLLLDLRDRHLADSTIRNIYTVLRAILDGAVRDGLLATNPCVKVPRPTIAAREATHLEPFEVKRLLEAARASRYGAVFELIASTGMRRGEALGLRWEDIDLDGRVLHVRHTLARVDRALTLSQPKTANSRRDIPLIDQAVTLLRKHRVDQVELRLRAGDRWQDRGFVFTTEFGTPVEPRNLLRVMSSAAARADLSGIGIHTLRHSAATAMLNAGIPLHIVSRLLGHSSISITGDIYGHASDTSKRDAVAALANAIGF